MTRKKQSVGDISITRLQKASMALDDLVWTLQSLKLDNVKEAASVLRASIENSVQLSAVSQGYKSRDPNKHFLIGVLPRLFQDKHLFPQNEDIVDFAGSALGLEMSRSEKRSRYEIIGKVVCETDQLDEYRLTSLVSALEKLVGNNEKLALMAEKKRAGSFSWNETIQELLKS
jgi:hypothetical protein